MKIVSIAITALLLSFNAAAAEFGDIYKAVGLVQSKYKESGFESLNTTVVQFTVGKQIQKDLAFEGRFGAGVSDDTIVVSGNPITLEIDNFVGVYAKVIAPIENNSLYGLFGYTNGRISASGPGGSLRVSDSDFSIGFGADFQISGNTTFNAEYCQLFSGQGYDVTALSFNVRMSY